MTDFMTRAEELFWRNEVPPDRQKDLAVILQARERLQAAHAKARLDVNNIESVLGAFEMARILGRMPGFTPEEVEHLAPAMRTVIATTLEAGIEFRRTGADAILAPQPYDTFAKLVTVALQSIIGDVAIISFNYDVGVDYALAYEGHTVDYGLGDPVERAVPLLKPHGSLNWARCAECEAIQPFDPKRFFPAPAQPYRGTEPVYLPVTRVLSKLEHHNRGCLPEPVIVPPTWNKTQYRSQIEAVWRRTADELSEAENIIVIGYSAPQTDEFFRYLFGLGCIGERLLRRVIVCDPDEQVAVRFRGLLSSATEGGFRHLPIEFRAATVQLYEYLGLRRP